MTPELIVHRSSRRPRLYVLDRHGRQVGWLDLTTGRRTVTDAALATEVDTALREFQRMATTRGTAPRYGRHCAEVLAAGLR